nr:FimB/Mfa2 family fimbrial subunit [Bacteroides salyersiae]
MYNSPDGFSITTDDATVNKATDGNTLLPTPGALFTGAAEFTAVADDTLGCVIPVVQRTRSLLFRLTVTDGAPERIASLSGTLSGVAGSIRLATGELSGAGSVIPAFTRSGAEITASLNLLGMTGTQRLTLLLTFTDGLTQTIESDLTEQLAHFNDSHTALEVSGTLKTPTAIQPGTSTITDWQVQEEKDITIN